MIENSTELMSQKLFEKFPDDLYRHLSLTARMAVALHCFSRYCSKLELRHDDIDAFVDYLWEFPLIERWDLWEEHAPRLLQVALGDNWPADLQEFLLIRLESANQFRTLLGAVAEIVFGSGYGAADDEMSMRYLAKAIYLVDQFGVRPPPPEEFAESLFVDNHGWGNKITEEVRNRWRSVVA